MNKSIITTNEAPEAIGPYSQGVKAGPFIFTSGQIPLDCSGKLVEGGIKEQTRQVFKNCAAVLKGAGASLEDVVKVTVFLKDMAMFSEMNEVYAEYFGKHRPARSTVEVSRLPKDVLVEIEMTAVVKETNHG